MIITIPENRACPGKDITYPITNYNPALWIKTAQQSHSVVTIDGFIVTQNNRVNGIFKKLEYVIQSEQEEPTLEQIAKVVSPSELKILADLAGTLQCPFRIFIWPENYPLGFDTQEPLIFSLKLNSIDDQLQVEQFKRINLDQLEQGIRKLRGFSFSSVKNLKSASSNVECYLANNTTNPWPGDIDALLFNHTTGRFDAIIEFKTHNIDSPIENERIGKYGQEDWRRFNVLFDLIDNCYHRLGYRPKLFFIVWGTNEHSTHHDKIKIDLIERDKIVDSTLFPRPGYNVFSQDLFDLLIKKIDEA